MPITCKLFSLFKNIISKSDSNLPRVMYYHMHTHVES